MFSAQFSWTSLSCLLPLYVFPQFTVCFVWCPFDLLQSLFFGKEELMFYNDLKSSWSKMHEGLCYCLQYSLLLSVLVCLRSGRKKRPLVLSFSSFYTLHPDIRNKMSKITLFCIGFDAECSSITNKRYISFNYFDWAACESSYQNLVTLFLLA